MNVIRFLLGVTTVVALTGFAPVVGFAEEPLRAEKMICTPLVYEHELGGNFQRIGVLKLERELPSGSPTFYWRVGAQLLENYTMDRYRTEGQTNNFAFGERQQSYGSVMSPTFEIGRKSVKNPFNSVGFYSSFGIYSTERIIDTGVAVRCRWGVLKAGFFQSTYRQYKSHLDTMDPNDRDATFPAAMTYISFGVGPSFRF